MTTQPPHCTPELAQEIDDLVDECRLSCLWYAPRDYYPRTLEERMNVLDAIQRRSDRATFVRTARIKQCLSRNSSNGSADS